MTNLLYKYLRLEVFLVALFLGLSSEIQAQEILKDVQMKASHPRLLMGKTDEASVRAAIRKDRFWKQIDSLLMEAANEALSLPAPQRIVTGRRLLDVSRETLRRILLLGYAYRMTGDSCYGQRAEQELLAVSAFSDWNPSHYLDVAEMTTAVAIGYDWLFGMMSNATKATIRQAILTKGLKPSFDARYNDWLERENNWNQVCNTAMAYGALAIYEDVPSLADSVIQRSISSIHRPMKNYGPDGAYPEGYSYWGFGTTYNVMLIDALEKCFGTDFNLLKQKGFLATAGFILHMVAPDHDSFNYGDNKDSGRMSPAMFWLAKRNKDLSLLWNERSLFKNGSKKKLMDYRFFTLALLWGGGVDMHNLPEPLQKTWISPAAMTPVALMRTSWNDKKAIYLAFKGGTATSSHAHLDAGSFVMVANGERWAMDFGRQDYNSLESLGLDIWNKAQNSDRWKVFRYNNLAHNTLTFDNRLQRVEGYVCLDGTSSSFDHLSASADLTPVYAGLVKSAKRRVEIVEGRYVLVTDDIRTNEKPTTMRWTMLTPANAELKGKNKIVLNRNGKRLVMEISAPVKVRLRTWSTAPTTSYDAPNPGTVLVGFESVLPANSQYTFRVKLMPE
ncbi:heparinase II/III domain-containing protein [Segatella buccae]|uniref:heparinase II/III domain-containing protein n=1 Tax=Segatella buccae TaxID=28126 RepID=UPI0022DEE00E|nr:heparinase II/III family protein [Segatella buccae]